MVSSGEYATAIRLFAYAVHKIIPDFDTETLGRFAGECQKITDKTNWEYNLRFFSFPKKRFKETKLDNTRPTNANSYEITIAVKLEGIYTKGDNTDSIKNLEVNVFVHSFLKNDSAGPCCAWHLDSHPPVGASGDTDSPFAHPRYHWQYGGDKIWEAAKGDDMFYGSHLLLESPRLPHPPLDVILAIDYVFANFYGKDWEELKKDDDYNKCIEKSQEMYWKPYFSCIYSYWNSPISSDSYKMLPHLPLKKIPDIGIIKKRKK